MRVPIREIRSMRASPSSSSKPRVSVTFDSDARGRSSNRRQGPPLLRAGPAAEGVQASRSTAACDRHFQASRASGLRPPLARAAQTRSRAPALNGDTGARFTMGSNASAKRVDNSIQQRPHKNDRFRWITDAMLGCLVRRAVWSPKRAVETHLHRNLTCDLYGDA